MFSVTGIDCESELLNFPMSTGNLYKKLVEVIKLSWVNDILLVIHARQHTCPTVSSRASNNAVGDLKKNINCNNRNFLMIVLSSYFTQTMNTMINKVHLVLCASRYNKFIYNKTRQLCKYVNKSTQNNNKEFAGQR